MANATDTFEKVGMRNSRVRYSSTYSRGSGCIWDANATDGFDIAPKIKHTRRY